LVANAPHVNDAVQMWSSWPVAERPSLGIHINVTEGVPCADPRDVQSLCGEDGLLCGSAEFWSRIRRGDVCGVDMYAETTAQIMRFVRLTGRLPAHVDGHHHCHVASRRVCEAVSLALKDCHIYGRRVRMPFTGPTCAQSNCQPCEAAGTAAEHARRVFRAHGFVYVPHFMSLTACGGGGVCTETLIRTAVDHLRNTQGSTELMCHPAYHDPTGHGGWYGSAERCAEMNAIIDAFGTKNI
jgi:predicted glycoside hydrolase/deacetylase ChbG (UPF0249 family)